MIKIIKVYNGSNEYDTLYADNGVQYVVRKGHEFKENDSVEIKDGKVTKAKFVQPKKPTK